MLDNKALLFVQGGNVVANNITITHAQHANLWNNAMNGKLLPEMFTYGSSSIEVYWLCPHGRDHTYKQDIASRLEVNVNYCRKCKELHLPQKINDENSLERKQNVGKILSPSRVGIEQGAVIPANNITITHKEYIELWNDKANGNKRPEMYTYGSQEEVYWLCPHGRDHTYLQKIHDRLHAKLNYCKKCHELNIAQDGLVVPHNADFYKNRKKRAIPNNKILAYAKPELMQYWAKENVLDPYAKGVGSGDKALWICPKCNKNYSCKIVHRVKRKTPLCNDCAGYTGRTNISLRQKYPEYAKLMNETLNGDKTPDSISFRTHDEVTWNCPNGQNHTYIQPVDKRINAPLMYCRECYRLGLPQKDWQRKKRTKESYEKQARPIMPKERYLGYAYPELLPLWDKERNKGIDPYTVTIGSTDGYYWHCPHDELVKHSYKATPYVMTKDVALTLEKGHCNICRGLVVLEGYNDIASWAKRNGLDYLIEEWDNEKNGNIKITDRPFGSGKTAAWVCRNCGYSWEASINNRTANRSGCPLCNASKLEQFGYEVLTQWNVRFIKEKRFTEFYNISSFQFDYYLPDYKIIIEFDGLQHFKEDVTWKEIIPFNERVRRDKIKNTVLFKNGVPILRIPYIYDPTKKKYQDQIEAYIKTFIQTKKIPQHIIDFYASYNFSNYAELARKWNDTLS